MEKVSFDTWDDFIKALLPSYFNKEEVDDENKDLENFKHKKIQIKEISNINFGEKFQKNQNSLQALYKHDNYYNFKNKLESLEITFLKSVEIRNTNDIDFPKSIFNEDLEISTDTNIKFKYSKFYGNVSISGKNQDGFKIEFLDCKLNKFSNTFIQNQDKAFGEYSFWHSFVEDIQLLSPKNFKYIVHREDNKKNKYEKVSLYLNSKGTEKILIASIIDKVSLGELKIFNNNDENININISNLNIQSVELRNGFFNNKFILINVSISDQFDIINCNLGQTTFNGVEINKLYLENATLNDCIFNGVDFPKDYKLEEGNLSSKQLKDNYRQLKFVMDKNGNHTEANKFYELEMEYYMKSLKIEKGFKQLLDFQFLGEDSKNIGEILILKFGYITSDFGNNLFRIFYTIFLYIALSFLLVWLLEKGFIKIFTDLIDYLTSDDLLQRLLIVFIVLFVLLIIDSIYKITSNKIKNIFSHSVIIVFFIILAFIIGFKYNMFHTLNILINPLSGLSKGDLEGYNSLEQFGFIIYKIIYGFLVYQLIVALKRTTKR